MANFVGLDITPDSVRATLIKTSLRKVQVARYVEVRLDSPAVLEAATNAATAALGGALLPAGALAPSATDSVAVPHGANTPLAGAPGVSSPAAIAVRECLRMLGTPNLTILAAMPGEEASIRRIELPAVVAKKVDELLPLEMEALVPFDAEDTILDHQPIGIEAAKIRLLVAAVPKYRVRANLDDLAQIGADPQELAVGAAVLDGVSQLVPELATEGPHVIIHLGASRVDVCVIRRGRTELARTLSTGYADLAMPSPESAINGSAERLSRELKQTVAGWRAAGGASPVSVYLSGVGLEDARTLGFFSEVFALQAAILPLPDAQSPTLGMESPELRARCGYSAALAARALVKSKRIDLRKGEFAASRTTGWIREHAGLLATCAGAIVLAFMFSTYARWSVLDARRNALEAELARVTEARLGESTRSPMRARALLETGGTRSDPMPRFTAYDALAAISDSVPEEVRHDVQRLQIDLGDNRSGGHFEISGLVTSADDRARIVEALGQVPCFRELEPGPLTQAPNERRSYRVEGDILCPGDEVVAEGRGRGRGRGRSRSTSGSSTGGQP